MTPEQALMFLDQLAALAPVARMQHAQALEAVKILKKALEDAATK